MQAATYELLLLIRQFDARGGWGQGFTSCAHWLNWRTGLALGAAGEKVRVAQALAELPRMHLDVWVDDDGMLVVRGRRSPEVGAVVQRAVDAASDRLYHDANDTAEVSVSQRRADALELIAESALAADLDRGTAGDRYQVVVHVEADGLRRDAEAGQSALDDGIGVSAQMSRRLACDASTVVMTHARDGTVLDVGRKTRTIPPAIRRALTAQDRRCRFPGCDAHHVRHWADGGATRLDTLVLVCRHHHRAVHEEGFTVELGDTGEARFFWPDGRPIPDVPPAPIWAGRALASTDAHLETPGLRIDPHTATPDWGGERLDVDWAITVLHLATADPSRSDLSAGTWSTPDGSDIGAVN